MYNIIKSIIEERDTSIPYKDYTSCGSTTRYIMKKLFPKQMFYSNCFSIDDADNEFDSFALCMKHCINEQHICSLVISTDIDNDHAFIIFKDENKYFRVESYVNKYYARIVEFDDYETQLKELLLHEECTNKWNTLFDVNEYNLGSIQEVSIKNMLYNIEQT